MELSTQSDRRRHVNEQWRRSRGQKSHQPVNRTVTDLPIKQGLWEVRKPFKRTKTNHIKQLGVNEVDNNDCAIKGQRIETKR